MLVQRFEPQGRRFKNFHYYYYRLQADTSEGLTPSQHYVETDTAPFRGQRLVDEHVQVQALDEDPHLADADGVDEDGDEESTLPVLQHPRKKACCMHDLLQQSLRSLTFQAGILLACFLYRHEVDAWSTRSVL